MVLFDFGSDDIHVASTSPVKVIKPIADVMAAPPLMYRKGHAASINDHVSWRSRLLADLGR
jgi:hypothetical protein